MDHSATDGSGTEVGAWDFLPFSDCRFGPCFGPLRLFLIVSKS
jgi:hypothetical protein